MLQHIVTAEGVGARYRRNVQQYLLILIHSYGTGSTGFIKCRKNKGVSKMFILRERNIEMPCPSMLRQRVGVFLDV